MKVTTIEERIRKVKSHTYDLSPVSVEDLLVNPGFNVVITYYAHIIANFPEHDAEYLQEIRLNMKKKDTKIFHLMKCPVFITENRLKFRK